MKIKLTIIAGLSMLAAGLYSENSSAALINFDSVANGTSIANTYAGVTFGCTNGIAGFDACQGTANAVFFSAASSPPNVVGFAGTSGGFAYSYPIFDTRVGTITAAFATPVSFVSIGGFGMLPPEYLGTASPGLFLDAFDSGGNLLSEVMYDGTVGTWQTLEISDATADISSVAFSSRYANGSYAVYGSFDNLCYGTSSNCGGGDGGTIPEPDSLALLGLGLAGLAVSRRLKGVFWS